MIKINQTNSSILASIFLKNMKDPDMVEELLILWEDYKVEKNEFLLKENDICNYLYFLEEGALKKFYFSEGNEHVTCITTELSFITALHSFLNKEPSLINLKTLENCKLKRISFQNWSLMHDKYPQTHLFIKSIFEKYYCGLERHIINLQKRTAEERFSYLMSKNPEIFNRIRLKDIASFLKMTPETLSRIRASKI
jgi:CRP-like cAMP-binding protein